MLRLRYKSYDEAFGAFVKEYDNLMDGIDHNFWLSRNIIDHFFDREMSVERAEEEANSLVSKLGDLENATDLCYTSKTNQLTNGGEYYGVCIDYVHNNMGSDVILGWLNEASGEGLLNLCVLAYAERVLSTFIDFCFEEEE